MNVCDVLCVFYGILHTYSVSQKHHFVFDQTSYVSLEDLISYALCPIAETHNVGLKKFSHIYSRGERGSQSELKERRGALLVWGSIVIYIYRKALLLVAFRRKI